MHLMSKGASEVFIQALHLGGADVRFERPIRGRPGFDGCEPSALLRSNPAIISVLCCVGTGHPISGSS